MLINMKLYRCLAAILLLVAMTFVLSVNAKDKRVGKMYVYGVATSFNDSTVYFTSIQEIDSVEVIGKTKLLANKQEYSWQLRNFFNNKGLQYRTCVTINSSNRKELEKSCDKLKQKYVRKWNYILKNIDESEFKYERVVMAQ